MPNSERNFKYTCKVSMHIFIAVFRDIYRKGTNITETISALAAIER